MEKLKEPTTIGLVAVGLGVGYVFMEMKKTEEALMQLSAKNQNMENRLTSLANLVADLMKSKDAVEEVTKSLSEQTKTLLADTKNLVSEVETVKGEVEEGLTYTEEFIEHYNATADAKFTGIPSKRSVKEEAPTKRRTRR